MTTWNLQLTRLRQQLARIAITPGTTLHDRAEAALTVLEQVLPFDAAWLAVRDPELGRHTPPATAGAAEPLRRYFQTPEADAEVEQLGFNRHRPRMLASEIPVPLSELRAWLISCCRPGSAAAWLPGCSPPVGGTWASSACSARTRPDPSQPAREAIAAVTTVIAFGLDRTPEIAAPARIIEAATVGILLILGGNTPAAARAARPPPVGTRVPAPGHGRAGTT